MKNGTTKNDLDAALELLRRLVYMQDYSQSWDTQNEIAKEDARRFLARLESRNA